MHPMEVASKFFRFSHFSGPGSEPGNLVLRDRAQLCSRIPTPSLTKKEMEGEALHLHVDEKYNRLGDGRLTRPDF